MKNEYIVSEEYIAQKGLNLNDYAIDGTAIPAIINNGLDLLITRISYLDDNHKGEEKIEKYLDEHPEKVGAFYKAQYRCVYNLVFMAETNPLDPMLDNIIVHELDLGAINGWQKGIYYEHNKR